MDRIEIDTPEQLHAWLKEHHYFVECDCLSAHPTAEDYPPEHAEHLDRPETVTVELAYQVGGGWMAGEERVIRVFRCTGRDVRAWTPGPAGETYMDGGVEVLENCDGLGLNLDACGVLVCGRLTIAMLPDRTLPVEARLQGGSFTAKAPAGWPPTPADWLQWFAEAGEDVVWRVHGGMEWPVGELETDTYTAFLQRRSDLATTLYGVFVEVRRVEGGGFHLSAQGAEGKLWRIVRESILRFPAVRVTSGNCAFTRQQWESYVRNGTIPIDWLVDRP